MHWWSKGERAVSEIDQLKEKLIKLHMKAAAQNLEHILKEAQEKNPTSFSRASIASFDRPKALIGAFTTFMSP